MMAHIPPPEIGNLGFLKYPPPDRFNCGNCFPGFGIGKDQVFIIPKQVFPYLHPCPEHINGLTIQRDLDEPGLCSLVGHYRHDFFSEINIIDFQAE